MTKPRFLLDTDISSFIIRDISPALRQRLKFIPPDEIAISVITKAELLFCLRALPASDARRTSLNNFLSLATILPWTSPAAEAYADIRFTLTRSAQLIGELDMLIAAHAIAEDLTLVTNNTRHFSRVTPPLRLENWTEE